MRYGEVEESGRTEDRAIISLILTLASSLLPLSRIGRGMETGWGRERGEGRVHPIPVTRSPSPLPLSLSRILPLHTSTVPLITPLAGRAKVNQHEDSRCAKVTRPRQCKAERGRVPSLSLVPIVSRGSLKRSPPRPQTPPER